MAIFLLHYVIHFLLTFCCLKIDGQEMFEFIAKRPVYPYRSYKDMQLFHFSVPELTLVASLNLTSGISDSCNPRHIGVYVQADSYPVISPEGAKFPELLWIDRQKLYQAKFLTDLNPFYIKIPCPQPGNWFMAGYINDNSNRITQAGLVRSCFTWLQAEITYKLQVDIIVLNITEKKDKSTPPSFSVTNLTNFRVFIPLHAWSFEVQLKDCLINDDNNTISNDLNECPIEALMRPGTLPYKDNNNTQQFCEQSSFTNGTCQSTFTPAEGKWHYFSIEPLQSPVTLSVIIYLKEWKSDLSEYPRNHTHLDSYLNVKDFPSGDVQWETLLIQETSVDGEKEENIALVKGTSVELEEMEFLTPASLIDREFNISVFSNDSQLEDITLEDILDKISDSDSWVRHKLVRKTFPGNFIFEFDLPPNVEGAIPIVLNLTNESPAVLSFSLQAITDVGGTLSVDMGISPFMNASLHNYTVIGCLTLGIRGDFNQNNNTLQCKRGRSMRANTSHPSVFFDSVMVPYPEPGPWFLTLLPVCFLNDSDTYVRCLTNETSVIFSVSSTPCFLGKCGRYGSCYQYISGGLIFSTCVCKAGYRGWACSDDSHATPSWKLLLSKLLLTLSNLFFIPAIILALYRYFITEALVYTFTMVFSIFYHACDEDGHTFCLMPLHVLQFGDFYCAILSFWVTLINMSGIPHRFYSFLYMVGAMTVALGVEYNKRGIWVFAIPSISAFCIMAFSWGYCCRRTKNCYPPRSYWLRHLVPGTLFAATGLISYAFFETEDNYFLVHSFWHVLMALSIVCLLPKRESNCHVLNQNSVEDGDVPSSDNEALTSNQHNFLWSLLGQSSNSR